MTDSKVRKKWFLFQPQEHADGLVPIPVLMIFIYIFIHYFLFVHYACNISWGPIESFWFSPVCKGYSLLHFVKLADILFMVYILVAFALFLTSTRKKLVRYWIAYAYSFIVLLLLHRNLLILEHVNGLQKIIENG